MKVLQTEVIFGLPVSPEHPFGCFWWMLMIPHHPFYCLAFLLGSDPTRRIHLHPLLLLLLLVVLTPPRAIPLFLLGLFRSQLIIFRILNGILFIKNMKHCEANSCVLLFSVWYVYMIIVCNVWFCTFNLSCFPSTGSTALKTEGVPLAFLDLDCRPWWGRVCPTWWPCSGCGGVYWCLWWQCQISLALGGSEGAHQRIWNIGVHSIPKK